MAAHPLSFNRANYPMMLENLLALKPDLEAENALGRTALIAAAQCGNVVMTERLISASVSLSSWDKVGPLPP